MNVHIALIRDGFPTEIEGKIYERYQKGLASYGRPLDKNSILQSGEKPTLDNLKTEILDELIDALAYLQLAIELSDNPIRLQALKAKLRSLILGLEKDYVTPQGLRESSR